MRFYRVTWYHNDHGTGYIWANTRRDAVREAKAWHKLHDPDGSGSGETKIVPVDIDFNRAGIFEALQKFASHNDNG